MAVTSRDVARRAGVSQATVSRVLNGNYPVSAETREAVLAALADTGYVRNAQATAMRTAKSGTIGLVTSEIQNPYFPYLLDELTKAAIEQDVHPIVWNDATGDVTGPREGLASGAVDGLIFTTAREGMPGVDALIAANAPIVLCNRAPVDRPVDVVMNDHETSGRDAAEYLLARGRRRIAAVFGSPDTYATPLRERGFREALAAAGAALPDDLVRRGSTGYETGRDSALALLQHRDRFDAVFCSSDIIAFGLMDAFRQHGLRVPTDVWVIGIDGLQIGEWGAYDLTTISHDVAEIARRAVERLIARVDGRAGEQHVDLVAASLVERGSTAS